MIDPNDNKTLEAFPVPAEGTEGQASTLDKLVQAHGSERDYANQLHGKLELTTSMRKFFRAGEIKFLKEIRDSKLFKHIPVKHPDGVFAPAKTFGDYCQLAQGIPGTAVYEEIQTHDLLKDDAYESINQLGLHRSQKRALRQLPEAKAQEIAQELGKEEADQTKLKNFVLDVLADHARQMEEAKEAHAREKAALEQEKAALQQALEKDAKRVDAAVKAETAGLAKERDALIKENRELQERVQDPAWNLAVAHAKQLAELLDAVRAKVETAVKTFPAGGELPAELELRMDAHVMAAFACAEAMQERWNAAKERRAGHG